MVGAQVRRNIQRKLTMGACAVVVVLAAVLGLQASASAAVPDGFVDQRVAGGDELPAGLQLNTPTAIAFLPDGRMLVTQKSGKLRIVENGAVLQQSAGDLESKVNADGDGGLIGVAVDTNYTVNNYIYLLYTNRSPQEGRLSRFTLYGNKLTLSSETVLLRMTSDNVSHQVDTVRTGPNNTLYVSTGDSSPFDVPTIGSTRAQVPSETVGRIFRITTSGQGLSSNPFWTGNANDTASKVFALGMRNPFRFSVLPDGGVIVGDVGLKTYEEINRIPATGGNRNFGWPCYEGTAAGSKPQPLFGNFDICKTLLAKGPSAVTAPVFSYEHTVGSAITGGAVYNGNQFPAPYKGAYYFGDYTGNWIKYWPMSSTGAFVGQPAQFATVTTPVDIQVGSDGALYYVAINAGEIRRITFGQQSCQNSSYTATYYTNATFDGTPAINRCETAINNDWGDGGPFGAAPTDNFSVRWQGKQYFSQGVSTVTSTSDDGMQVWVDGQLLVDNGGIHGAQAKSGTVTYANAGYHDVRVEYTEASGQAVAKVAITNSNKPPVPVIATPANGASFNLSDAINLTGSASDPEQGTLPASALRWQAYLHHCPPPPTATSTDLCHTHPYFSANGATATLKAPDTLEDWIWLEVQLISTDANGATGTTTVNLYPNVCPVGQYQAFYYKNANWSGTPAISRCETSINNNWNTGGPFGASPVDNFSAQWQGARLFPAGTSTLSLNSDDGSQVWVDGKLVIDNGGVHGPIIKSAQVSFAAAGYHDVLVRYFENDQGAVAQFTITAGTGPGCPDGEYLAQYYANTGFSGTPTITRCDGTINFDWGTAGPFGVSPVDGYTVQWSGRQYFAAGSNTLRATSDDGMLVYVDGVLVLDHGGVHSAYPKASTISFAQAGYHDVVVRYTEVSGNAWAQLSLEPTLNACAEGSYVAKYYNNTSWSGTPAISRCEAAVNSDWGTGGPFGAEFTNNFTAEWTGTRRFAAGTTTLSSTSDDGMQVFVDGKLVIDNNRVQAAYTQTGKVTFASAGVHTITVRYFEATGDAVAKFSVGSTVSP